MPSHHANAASALVEIRGRMDAAAVACDRRPADITLTAVSKQQPWTAIAPVVAAGQRTFGENRVQEAEGRWSGRRDGLELRLIGPLQTNKIRAALAMFDVIETLDRPRLAASLVDEINRLGRAPRLYIQVNIGDEPQKAGVSPVCLEAFLADCRGPLGLDIEGLMCIPPQGAPPAPYFALLAKMARENGLTKLSMGMSSDFEMAIRHGATSVRVGSALFGARDHAPPLGAASST